MTQEELEKLFIKTIDGIFTPEYTYDDYDAETRSYSNLIIVKTAEEVYQEWLESKDKQIDICPEKTSEERITQLETDKVALAENVFALAEIIEVLLGGTEDGQSSTTAETATD